MIFLEVQVVFKNDVQDPFVCVYITFLGYFFHKKPKNQAE